MRTLHRFDSRWMFDSQMDLIGNGGNVLTNRSDSFTGHAHIRQCVQESRQQLHKMLRLLSIKNELLAHLDVIADVSYAWLLVDAYTAQMQGGIKENPKMVVKLRATFLKLASALDLPLLRIIQASSKGSYHPTRSRRICFRLPHRIPVHSPIPLAVIDLSSCGH